MKKFFYLSPEIEVFEFVIQKNILQVSNIESDNDDTILKNLSKMDKVEISSRETEENATTEDCSIAIGVLGMPGAGKTTFLQSLGVIRPQTELAGTSEVEYNDTEIIVEGQTIPIAAGSDINGADTQELIISEWIRTKNILVFIFDGDSLINGAEYRGNVIRRLGNLLRSIRLAGFNMQRVILIASHADCYQQQEYNNVSMKDNIKGRLHETDCFPLFENHFYTANLTNRGEVEELAAIIFGI